MHAASTAKVQLPEPTGVRHRGGSGTEDVEQAGRLCLIEGEVPAGEALEERMGLYSRKHVIYVGTVYLSQGAQLRGNVGVERPQKVQTAAGIRPVAEPDLVGFRCQRHKLRESDARCPANVDNVADE